MSLNPATIIGTGIHIPDRQVTNFDLEKIMDTSDEWIQKRSGIVTRYHAHPKECTSELGAKAAQHALDSARLKATDIDMIITATLSPDHHFPGIGVKIQHALGLETTPAMDIRNQCSGFLYALNVAKMFVATGQCRYVLVACSEIHSKLIDLTTRGRDIAVLFGDGAGAVVVGPSDDPEKGILSCHLYSQGEHFHRLWLERPGTTGERFMEEDDLAEGRHFPYMDGRYVFKHATTRLAEAVTTATQANHLQVQDIDVFLFHQANIRINENVAKTMDIPMEKVPSNIQKYGNCSAASLPILLHETLEAGDIQPGKLVCFGAFGAGFTWGSAVVRF